VQRARQGCGSAGASPWDGETAIKRANWDVSVPPLSSLPTAQTDNKKRPVASGRCQSAGNALVRSCCGSGHAGTQCYRGINIPRSPCHGGADPRYEIWCSSHRFTIPASPSRCRLLPESQRHWARGGGLRGWGDGGFVRLGRVSGRDEPAHQPRSGNAASTTLAPLSRAPTRTVSGARLRAGLTGRNRKVNAARRIRGTTVGPDRPTPRILIVVRHPCHLGPRCSDL
jgi:hypothetical protein